MPCLTVMQMNMVDLLKTGLYYHTHKEYHMSEIKPVDYVLEATSTEYQMLWNEYHNHKKFQNWISMTVKHSRIIGYVNERPICITFGYSQINGKIILVWELSSQLADYAMSDDWLKENFEAYKNGKHCNAMNFCHILSA